MEVVADDVHRRGGREILLQVERDNAGARRLYDSLAYELLGSMTSWRLTDSRAQDFARAEADQPPLKIRELPGRLAGAAYDLDTLALDQDLHWPDPLPTNAYERGLLRRLTEFASGRKRETWMCRDDHGHLVGLASIHSEWGRAHQLSIRVHPQWRGVLERPLLRKLIRRVHLLPRRRVIFIHNADDAVMNALAPEAHFAKSRTLTHMRLILDQERGRLLRRAPARE